MASIHTPLSAGALKGSFITCANPAGFNYVVPFWLDNPDAAKAAIESGADLPQGCLKQYAYGAYDLFFVGTHTQAEGAMDQVEAEFEDVDFTSVSPHSLEHVGVQDVFRASAQMGTSLLPRVAELDCVAAMRPDGIDEAHLKAVGRAVAAAHAANASTKKVGRRNRISVGALPIGPTFTILKNA